MLDHVGISVPASRLEEVTNWYLAALAPLGYTKLKEFPGHAIGLGPEKYSVPFWISTKAEHNVGATHIAFRCDKRTTVDLFHEEGLKAGGKCNGQPGLRHQYHAKYYAAFVYDPVGNNVEVVDHGASH
ncbi:glyoxalase/bleomycin resistance protein/dioxygenase [Setomelanomma holmii]|uniref:Glyoxalase/bleomycin resistance protein/dioxygenase n=1 Tax=Setomelanomma holmii TaxID=210430 RepID=A0A9P4HIE0_9PLEO|nr:glyoxalase/bleomycin resistance protein/dioxygenase [Setomelanomma holmii]